MARVGAPALSAFAAGMVWMAPCVGTPADAAGNLYALISPPSALEVGCQDPCACAIVARPACGSFTLVLAGSDPLYTHYAIEHFLASFDNGPGAVAITGSGKYVIGGEVALVQELTLDLVIQGRPAQHFDSGLVPVTAPFPRLDLSCAVHGFYCYDSVLVVDAKPVLTLGVDGPSAAPGLRAVIPNPSRGRVDITLTLDRPGTVDLAVVDLAGRRVCTLAAGEPLQAGPHDVVWEGRRDDGRTVPAGVYWLILRSPGRVDRRCFVRLD